jgi:hypothetical protein
VYPNLHEHVNDPGVSTQSAFVSQLWLPVLHSGISLHGLLESPTVPKKPGKQSLHVLSIRLQIPRFNDAQKAGEALSQVAVTGSQENPSAFNIVVTALHEHLKLPGLLIHVSSQPPLLNKHSLMSSHAYPLLFKLQPEAQEQTKLPGVSWQV